MSTARQTILAAIARANTDRPAADIRADAAGLIERFAQLRPDFHGQTLLMRFVDKATSDRVTATVQQLDNIASVPAAVADYLDSNSLGRRLALQPRALLAGLDWAGIDITSTLETNEEVALTLADMGVAETGSVVFLSAPDAPVLMNFLPLHHLVVLRQSTLLSHLEDVFDRIGQNAAAQPRSINIVTGTSGTADIEARNVRGAHGPRFMHIMIAPDYE
jgi:L-lactate dehydrogenase complex protein LldG